jgi:hypothetical protein
VFQTGLLEFQTVPTQFEAGRLFVVLMLGVDRLELQLRCLAGEGAGTEVDLRRLVSDETG